MATALVTGASRGLGRAVATGLAESGWRLILTARTPDDLAAVVTELRRQAEVTALAGDLTDPDHRNRLIGLAGGRLDLLVNNAGILGPSPQPRLADYPIDVLRTVYEINVLAPLALTQLALPALRAANGVLVNITSDAAVEGYEGWGGYGSGKAALEQASRVLAAEEPDIRVWWIDPGD
ncbi:MAG TPA: SDR family oxidoreductase, partial [Actinomycetes bacterium]|nr:SDR family oxidoreductase [Actinomycetes bacterium]